MFFRLVGFALLGVALVAVSAGCASTEPGEPDGSLADEAHVSIGLTDPETLDFVPLDAEGDVPLGTFGQGGHHASLALDCEGLGNRAYVEVTLRNLEGEGEVFLPPFARPQPLLCDEADHCRMVNLFVMTGGLAEPEALDGLHVEISATVRNEAGQEASDTTHAYLRMAGE